MTGNLSATGVVTGSRFQIGSNLFDYGSYANGNAFLGFAGAGNTNTTGAANTASGFAALTLNSTGSAKTATGSGALRINSTGSYNTAAGTGALQNNNTGSFNTAAGVDSLGYNRVGTANLGDGYWALFDALGSNNTGLGAYAGNSTNDSFTTGSNDTYVGYLTTNGTQLALNNATAVGANAEVDVSNAMVLGSINGVNQCTAANLCASTFVGIGTTTPTYLLHIGNQGGPSYNNFLRIEGPASGSGNTLSLGGHGDSAIDAPGTVAGRFVVKDNGIVAIGIPNPLADYFQIAQGLGAAIAEGWSTYSSRRWKANIRPLTNAIDKVEQLRGVSYELKNSGKHEIGVIAEEVGQVVPEVVSYEKNGKDAQGVDYNRLTALLIEAVKQQQREIKQQQRTVKEQQRALKQQQGKSRPCGGNCRSERRRKQSWNRGWNGSKKARDERS